MKRKAILCAAVLTSILLIHEPVFAMNQQENAAATKKEYIASPSKVYVNGRKINYPVDPIVKNGTTLVPIRETFEAMGASVYWDEETKTVHASKADRNTRLQIGSFIGHIDENPVDLLEAPVIYEDKTMIPLRFVGEAFDGVVNYNIVTKTIEITMPKFTVPFLTKEQRTISNIQRIENVRLANSRRFMLSDNPETLDANTIRTNNATLWNDVVKEPGSSIDHRVAGWHLNAFNQKVTVGITIENLSSTNTIEVRNSKGVHKISAGTSEYDIGLPLTEAVLTGRMNSVRAMKEGKSFLLGSFTLKPGQMTGFLNDFTVVKTAGTGEMDYVIRTVVSKDNSSLTDIKSLPVPIDQMRAHPRGVWGGTDLAAETPAYNINDGAEQSYNISNGVTDNLFRSDNSLVKNAASQSNIGHYGASYKVRIPYVNPAGEDKTIRVRIGSRGGIYSGTVKTDFGVSHIPSLQPMRDVVTIIERRVTNEQGVIEFEVMHAGGSFLPIAINITAEE